jgi:ArsR family transcriptional regulator, virulence genes transcriptional regulator
MNLEELKLNATRAEGLLKALANQARLLILCELLKGERTVTELSESVGLSMSAVSQHLAKLREEEIVATRRESQTIWYTLVSEAATKLLTALYDVYCGPAAKPRSHRKAPKLR